MHKLKANPHPPSSSSEWTVVGDLGVSKEAMRINEVIRVSINPDRLVSL